MFIEHNIFRQTSTMYASLWPKWMWYINVCVWFRYVCKSRSRPGHGLDLWLWLRSRSRPGHGLDLRPWLWLTSKLGCSLDLWLQPWLRSRSGPGCGLDLWSWLRSRSRLAHIPEPHAHTHIDVSHPLWPKWRIHCWSVPKNIVYYK